MKTILDSPATLPQLPVKVAAEVWIATALLHAEHADRTDFLIEEIVERAARERLHESLRPGVRVHAALHCVSNRAPNPARLKMLYATGRSTRRLWRPGDPVHPQRTGRSLPDREEIPEPYRYLLDWYRRDYLKRPSEAESRWLDGILLLRGLGKEVWAGEDPDEYVRGLLEGWE